MTHLRIEQNNGVIEEVSSSIITKLYEIAHAGLDVSSNLQGRLHTPVAYRYEVQYLTSTYPNLYISSDDYAIPFEDPNMVTYLNSIGVGSNGMVTEAEAAAATIVANSQNTEVTKFNELRYFTNITQSKGGWTSGSSGYIRFQNWTALEEIDISNFTSLGHVGGYAYDDTFDGCTALKTVTASDKLTNIGWRAFYGCANLEHITGLSGTIQIANLAFGYCSKLSDEDIANVEFEPAYNGTTLTGTEAFVGTNFTEITLSSNTTKIPARMFQGCSNLETVNGLGLNITYYSSQCFQNCTKFTGPIDFTNVTHIGGSAFMNSGLTGAVDLQNIQSFDNATNFLNTDITSVNYHGNTISGYSGSFSGCKNLTTASGMQNVLAPCNNMFSGCTSLTSVDINWNNVTDHTVPENIFRKCSSLQSIDLTGATTINRYAFQDCTSLTQVTGTQSITSIGNSAFENCRNLQSIDISNVTSISTNAFANCYNISNFETLSLPNLTYLKTNNNGVFKNCIQIKHVTNLGTITSFGSLWDGMFVQCTGLLDVTIPETVTSIARCGIGNQTDNPNMKWVKILSNVVPTRSTTDEFGNVQSYSTGFGEKWRNNDVNNTYQGLTYPIYVKDNLYSDYTTTFPWNLIAFRIKPLSQFATDFPNG